MFSALRLTSWIYIIHFSFSYCKCNLVSFFPKGEPGSVSCLPRSQSNHVVTWYRNDIKMPATNFSRVYQQANLLWFYPAQLEDSGTYQCTSNSSSVNKNITVFDNSGLCFDKRMAFNQKVPLKYSGTLTCPDLQNYSNDENAPFALQWYKKMAALLGTQQLLSLHKRSPYVIPDFSLSCFLWKMVPRLLCIFSAIMLNISAFRIHRVENADNCQDHTINPWPTFVLEGEPTVLKCLQYKNIKPFDLSLNLTWEKKGSSTIIPVGFKGPRIKSQDDAFWLLPTTLQDSGEYICTQRNSSYCAKVSMHLEVVKINQTNNISYPQKAFQLSSGRVVCPDLENFIQNNTNYELRWYKDSIPLNMDNKKFAALNGTNYLLVNPILMNDSGYYTCEMTFEFEKEQYNITRTIQLQIFEQKKINVPVIVNPDEMITSATLGSHLIIPCRVFIGANDHSDVDVFWLSNNSHIKHIYPDRRVKEGDNGQLVDNNNRSIEVQLIFDSITEADFHTDFRCVAQNGGGNRVQTVTVTEKKKDRELSWYLAVTPVALAVLIIGGIYFNKYWKQRSTKGYVVANS